MRSIFALFVLSLIGLSGCASLNHPVQMANLAAPSQHYLLDQTQPDDYPGFLVGEGSIYSCRYGIHYEASDEFTPPKAQMFADLLAQALPQITTHSVVLLRFDVYFNQRLQRLHEAANAGVGGIVGSTLSEQAALQNMGVFTYQKLLIDTNPEVDRHPGENQVGCDNDHEGEYYPSEISGGYDVVVSWFKFTVDGQPYEFRTFYQFQPQDKAAVSAGIDEAIRMSVQGIAQRIKL
jgi:hypothetical protein